MPEPQFEDNEESVDLDALTRKAAVLGERVRRVHRAKAADIHLNCLQAFVVAARHTSLSEAARRCNVKEDTFRKRLDALEIWADAVLLQRRPDLVLTPDGRRLLPFAQQALKAICDFSEEVSIYQAANIVRGKIRKIENGSLRFVNTAARTIVEID